VEINPRPKQWARVFVLERRKLMAKRKVRSGGGFKLRLEKDYRSDEYIPYIFRVESGILEAWTIEPDLRDGDVREILRKLISSIKKTGVLPEELSGESSGDQTKTFLEVFILNRLSEAFDEYGPLNAEDVTGILSAINHSVGSWNRGLHGQEYLKYIKDFLGGMGVAPHRLSEEEVKVLGLDKFDQEGEAL
jgi:hypothetical protein